MNKTLLIFVLYFFTDFLIPSPQPLHSIYLVVKYGFSSHFVVIELYLWTGERVEMYICRGLIGKTFSPIITAVSAMNSSPMVLLLEPLPVLELILSQDINQLIATSTRLSLQLYVILLSFIDMFPCGHKLVLYK